MPPNNPYTPQPQHGTSSPYMMPHHGGNSQTKLVIGLIVLTLVSVGLLLFAVWAFTGRQDYKNSSDNKVAAAVAQAEQETTAKNNERFAEESKSPLKKYIGPSSYGSIDLSYPKTWSGYVNLQSNNTSTPLKAYFHPDVVPALSGGSADTAIALTIEVLGQAYSTVLNQYTSQIKAGTVTASPYALTKVQDQIGSKLSGKISTNFTGTKVILPLRDKTLVITTQTDQYLSDFDTYILPNLSFAP